MELTATETRDGPDPVLILHPDDSRIDAAVAIRFKDLMRDLTGPPGTPDRVILDLDGVDFIDSSGLGAIVAAMKQMRDGQALELANLSPNVAKVFRLTRMDSVFHIHDNLADLSRKSA
jgi:anti-sigma B factor antagonist